MFICFWNITVQFTENRFCPSFTNHGRVASLLPGEGGLPLEGGTECAVVMTQFFQASRCSLAYQFTINASLMCPHFQFLGKICIFSIVFDQKFSSKDANFWIFAPKTPHFLRKPAHHIPTTKLSNPSSPNTAIQYPVLSLLWYICSWKLQLSFLQTFKLLSNLLQEKYLHVHPFY